MMKKTQSRIYSRARRANSVLSNRKSSVKTETSRIRGQANKGVRIYASRECRRRCSLSELVAAKRIYASRECRKHQHASLLANRIARRCEAGHMRNIAQNKSLLAHKRNILESKSILARMYNARKNNRNSCTQSAVSDEICKLAMPR